MDNPRSCGLITAAVAILSGLYCYWSFDIVFPTEVGIDFSLITYRLGSVYPPGRHWLGLGHRFILLPTKLETIDFSNNPSLFRRGAPLKSRTSDGLEVQLEVSLQYRLQFQPPADDVVNLYRKYGPDYDKVFVLAAIDTVTREATKHNATTFFSQRAWISDRIQDAMVQDFNNTYFSDIEFFQLRSVTLPQPFEAEIQNTEVQKQDIKKAGAERGHQEVSGETTVKIAEQQAQAIGLQAKATAATINLNNVAYVTQFTLTQDLQATGFQQIYTQLESQEEKLLEYLDVRALRDHPSLNSVISIPGGGPAM